MTNAGYLNSILASRNRAERLAAFHESIRRLLGWEPQDAAEWQAEQCRIKAWRERTVRELDRKRKGGDR